MKWLFTWANSQVRRVTPNPGIHQRPEFLRCALPGSDLSGITCRGGRRVRGFAACHGRAIVSQCIGVSGGKGMTRLDKDLWRRACRILKSEVAGHYLVLSPTVNLTLSRAWRWVTALSHRGPLTLLGVPSCGSCAQLPAWACYSRAAAGRNCSCDLWRYSRPVASLVDTASSSRYHSSLRRNWSSSSPHVMTKIWYAP